MWCVYIYIFDMYTCTPRAYVCVIYPCAHAVSSWLSAGRRALIALSSRSLSLHAASSSPGATGFPASGSSQAPGKALEMSHFPILLHQGLCDQKDGCFHQGWGAWAWRWSGSFHSSGSCAAPGFHGGLHNLLKFLSRNAAKSWISLWCTGRVQPCISPIFLHLRYCCSPSLAQIIKTWLFLATGFPKPFPFNWICLFLLLWNPKVMQ